MSEETNPIESAAPSQPNQKERDAVIRAYFGAKTPEKKREVVAANPWLSDCFASVNHQ
jgi:hypothetical protein